MEYNTPELTYQRLCQAQRMGIQLDVIPEMIIRTITGACGSTCSPILSFNFVTKMLFRPRSGSFVPCIQTCSFICIQKKYCSRWVVHVVIGSLQEIVAIVIEYVENKITVVWHGQAVRGDEVVDSGQILFNLAQNPWVVKIGIGTYSLITCQPVVQKQTFNRSLYHFLVNKVTTTFDVCIPSPTWWGYRP